MEGEVLSNRYAIEERIGEGGMALVYKAKDRLLHRKGYPFSLSTISKGSIIDLNSSHAYLPLK